MLLNFKKFADVAEAFVKDLAGRLGAPGDRDRAARILRNVLHLLRDQISPQESIQMISQLPMFLKAVYVDGWRIAGKPNKIRRYDTFIDEVRYPPGPKVYSDFESNEEAEESIRIVFSMISEKVSEGEMLDIISTLPTALRPFFQPVIATK